MASPALAQVPPQGSLPAPQTVTPPTPEPQKKSTVSIDSQNAIESRACPFDDSPLRLTLNQVEFTRPDGSPLQPEIAQALAGLVMPNGDQSVRAICDIRDAANAALRRGGWIASVQVPPQEITSGELKLNVVTAHIVETRVRGSAGPYERLIRKRIAQLEELNPLNERTAERILLLAGDIPGVDIRLSLRPAPGAPGSVIGELSINFRRFAVLGNAQNYSSKLLGRETAYVRAEAYGLTGRGDITYIGGSTTADLNEQKIFQIGHIMMLGNEGTTLGGRFSYAWSRPDLGALDYRTDTQIAGFDIAHPLLRSLNSNAGIAGGFDFVDQATNIATGNTLLPLTLDKMRIGFVNIAGDTRRVRLDGSVAWSLRGKIELRKGLEIFDATKPGFQSGRLQSRVDGNSRAFVARFDGAGSIGIGRYVNLLSEVHAQWANDSLLNYEEFSLGNLTTGRGYDPGSNSGDRAFGVRNELQVNLPITRKVSTQLFGFYDYVKLQNLDAGTLERHRRFRSFGGGFRVALPGKALLEMAYAHPLDRALTIDPAPPGDRLLVSLSFRFRDWAH